MKSSFFILIAISASVFSTADAHNKVVVIPMNDNSVPIRIYYGSVQGTGTLETGNIVSTTRNSEGSYSLEVGSDVGGCALTVSKGSQGGGSSNIYGNITASVPSSGTAVAVRTRDSSGVLDDTDFHFTMICPKL